jgi:hypothetical protein
MKQKPSLGFRKPPASKDADAFVFAEGSSQAPKRSSSRGPKSASGVARRKTIVRGDGRELRRISIYFPLDTAKRLAAHCAVEDVEISAYVAELVRKSLGA